MTKAEAQEILQAIKHYLTAGNPVWDVDEIAEACDMGIEALRNEINCVKCVHYTEIETYTGIKGVCKMDTAHRGDTISRQSAIEELEHIMGDHPLRGYEDELLLINAVKSLPSADAVEVVRCKDCKYGEYRKDFDDYECHASGCGLVYDAEFYCADGERRKP